MSTTHTPSQLMAIVADMYQRDAFNAEFIWRANDEEVSHAFVSPGDDETPEYLAFENTNEEEIRIVPRTLEVLGPSGILYIRGTDADGHDLRVTIVRLRSVPFTPSDLEA